MIIPIIINNNNKNSNDTIHTQKRKILFTDHHNTSVTNVHTRRTMWGARRSVLPDPPITPSGTATNQKTMIKKTKQKNPKSWLRRFQAAAERPDTVSLGGGLCFKSPFSPFLSICPPSLAHCLDPDRKPGRLGPESERRLFLLLCDCFLFTPAASLHAPGGPVLIRVPACSRAVPEGCGRRVPEWEEGKIKKTKMGWWVG